MMTGPRRAPFAEQNRWGWLILFSSTSTLICCALPILLVTFGLGAVSATLFDTLPFLVTLARHKLWMFLVSAVLLMVGGWALYRPGRYCPTDPELAALCASAHRWNRRVWWASIFIWAIGFFAAYLSLPLYEWLSPA
ncbi:MAG: hypothetical protein AAGK23_14280 [Pseudomonadota bacterium]